MRSSQRILPGHGLSIQSSPGQFCCHLQDEEESLPRPSRLGRLDGLLDEKKFQLS